MTGDPNDVTVVVQRPMTELRAWRSFAFGELPKLTRADARAVVTLQSLLVGGGATAIDAVRARLASTFDLPVKLIAHRAYIARPDELRRHAHSFLASISYKPQAPPAIVEVDAALAQGWVDALLGGTAESVPFRPLTDIEEGVIAFVLLEGLRGLAGALDSAHWRLQLEGILRTPDEMLVQLEGERRAAIIQIGCDVGAHAGLIRIIVPASTLEIHEAARPLPSDHRLRLSWIGTSLRAEIGRVELRADDLAGLVGGDVVVIGEVSVRSDRGQGGRAELRVGTGQAGWMDADVSLEGPRYSAAIRAFHFGAPRSISADLSGEVNMDDSQSDGTELLRDIPLQIAVELARVPITADEVARLQVGRVLDLRRGPGDPVSLSVNGKVIARGELVELEGQLGVRILSMG